MTCTKLQTVKMSADDQHDRHRNCWPARSSCHWTTWIIGTNVEMERSEFNKTKKLQSSCGRRCRIFHDYESPPPPPLLLFAISICTIHCHCSSCYIIVYNFLRTARFRRDRPLVDVQKGRRSVSRTKYCRSPFLELFISVRFCRISVRFTRTFLDLERRMRSFLPTADIGWSYRQNRLTDTLSALCTLSDWDLWNCVLYKLISNSRYIRYNKEVLKIGRSVDMYLQWLQDSLNMDYY